jgi:hypothetical protein
MYSYTVSEIKALEIVYSRYMNSQRASVNMALKFTGKPYWPMSAESSNIVNKNFLRL